MGGFAPGEYYGFDSNDWNAIMAEANDTLKAWMNSNFTPVAGGKYYVYNGSENLIEYMEDYGYEEYVQMLVYGKSNWLINGF